MSEAAAAKTGAGVDLTRPPARRRFLIGAGHLAALWALAFVQPLLDLLGKNPDFFVARGNTSGDILILAIGFTLLPPLVFLLVEWIVLKISFRAYYGLHFLLLTVAAAFFFIPYTGDLAPATPLVIVLSLLAGGLVAFAIFRFTFVRNLMDILIVAPLVILLIFIFASKTTDVILPNGSKFTLAKDSGNDHPIVLVVFDELGTADLMTSPRKIDAGRFPNFARMSREGTWYINHTTAADETPIAVPEIFTGIGRRGDTLPTWRARPQSIFSQFSRGRVLHVEEPVTELCPEQLCSRSSTHDEGRSTRLEALWSDLKYVEGRLILPPRVADTLPSVSGNFAGFGGGSPDGSDGSAADTASPADAGANATGDSGKAAGTANQPQDTKNAKGGKGLFVKKIAQRDPNEFAKPAETIPDSLRGLTVIHYELPHKTWKYDLRGRPYNTSQLTEIPAGGAIWPVNSNGISVSQSQMLVQTGFADRLMGVVRKRLRKIGLWNQAMVVVTADHGVSFEGGDVPQRQIDPRGMGETANPPLFIKYPMQDRGGISFKHSTIHDIVPTIARAVGVKDMYKTDGVPLQGPVPDRPVTLKDTRGGSSTSTITEVARMRNEAILRANERLGTGPFYTLGPAPDLVGKPAPPVPAGTGQIRFEHPFLWTNYRPGRKLIPMFVTGTTTIPVPKDPARAPVFAVAVNGTIQATARPFPWKGANWFGMLISPASLHYKRNEIGVYRVEGSQLIPIGGN